MRGAGKHKPLLLTGRNAKAALQVMVGELRLDILRVDLSAVVSEFIGETQKNLARVFDEAQESSEQLLFDEADALFGKRSEAKDAHDRLAHIEVSYLLRRTEARRELVILVSETQRPLPAAVRRRIVVDGVSTRCAHRLIIVCRGVTPSPASRYPPPPAPASHIPCSPR